MGNENLERKYERWESKQKPILCITLTGDFLLLLIIKQLMPTMNITILYSHYHLIVIAILQHRYYSSIKNVMIWIWAHNTVYRSCIIKLYTWNLYYVVNQCYSSKFNLKKWVPTRWQTWGYNCIRDSSGPPLTSVQTTVQNEPLSQRLSNLLEFTQLIRDRGRLWTQI